MSDIVVSQCRMTRGRAWKIMLTTQEIRVIKRWFDLCKLDCSSCSERSLCKTIKRKLFYVSMAGFGHHTES